MYRLTTNPMKSYYVIALSCFLLFSCTERTKDTSLVVPDSAHTSQNSLAWWGVYTGILPCADCEGIKTRLVINRDSSFQKTSEFLGTEADLVTADEGLFEWSEDGSSILMRGTEEKSMYQVGENRLILLDEERNPIKTQEASPAELHKQFPDDRMENIRWIPVEIAGQTVDESIEFHRPPSVLFSFNTSHIHGSGGCNTFFGGYKRDGYALEAKNIASTAMACTPELMDFEQALFGALNNVKSWSASEHHLSLLDADENVVARFERAMEEE